MVYNPTRVHFGNNVIQKLPEVLDGYGKCVLVVYGKGSVKRSGAYDDVMNALHLAGCRVVEYGGIKSNPVIEDVASASQLGVEKGVDFVLAVGGGSVIDSAKVIAIAIADRIEDPWLLMNQSILPRRKIPMIAVLTLAATGSEMNHIAVLQSNECQLKFGFKSILNFPDHSFLDPGYTISVPRNYTAYGIVDLMSHVLEFFPSGGDATLTDRFSLSILKEALAFGPALLDDLENYQLRAKIMWAATNALNGIPSYGKSGSDWLSHAIGHALSVLYDIPHGATLAVVMPAVLRFRLTEIESPLRQMGKEVFGVKSASLAIDALKSFYASLGVPVSLRGLNLTDQNIDALKSLINRNKARGRDYDLSDEERNAIVDLMVE